MSQLTQNTSSLDTLIAKANALPEAGSADPILQEKTVTPTASEQTIIPDSGYDGLSKVTVNAVSTETKSVTPTKSSQSITPTSGKFLSKVDVQAIPSDYIIPSGVKNITDNGTYDVTQYASVDVNVPSGGGEGGDIAEAPSDDVIFIDYDSKILYSFNSAEFLQLSSLPALPTHDGLTCQGWNWTFEAAKSYVGKYGRLIVGAKYITNDGKTRIYIRLKKGRLAPYLGFAINGTCVIDWGDGASSTVTGTSTSTVKSTNHIYASPGDYVISLAVTGSLVLTGNSSYGSQVLWKNSTTGNHNRTYQNAIQKVLIGNNVTTIGNYAFAHCYSLECITIPDSVSKIDGREFYYCYSLKSIIIPDSVTAINGNAYYGCDALARIAIPYSVKSISTNAFGNCYSLSNATIPDGVTTIAQVFYYCYSLPDITIPDSFTSIGALAFSNCYGLGAIRFKRVTPPTVSSSNSWTNVPTDCIIYVPKGSLSAYTTATNYPDPATYTYMEE